MSTMLYNGTELPALPHWDGMPPDYQFIFLSGGYYYLAGTNSAPFCVLVNGADRVTLRADVIFTAFEARAGAESWGTLAYSAAPFASLTDEGYVFNEAITFIWTQKDIPSATEGEVYLAGTEPTKPEVEEDPMIMFRRGWMDGFLTGLTARGLLRRRTVEEPAEIYYLYGTPSPTIVTYNGVELPELPEWDKEAYPYAYIMQKSSGEIYFQGFSEQMVHGTFKFTDSNGDLWNLTLNHFVAEAGTAVNYFGCVLGDNGWGVATPYTFDNTNGTDTTYTFTRNTTLWCNTDIPNTDDGTTYLAASDPVYTNSGNVAIAEGEGYVLYKGAVLPKLPEYDKTKYPYAVLGKWALGGGSYRYMLCYTTLPLYEGILGLSTPDGCIGLSYMYYEEEWQLAENWEDGSPFGLPSNPMWANYDIASYSDSTVLSVEASEPIPLASNEPVGVLYGNVALPELPDWDEETYPYAVIVEARYGNGRFIVSKNAPVLTWSEGAARPRMSIEGLSLHWYYREEDDAWDAGVFHECTDLNIAIDGDWTNTDLINPDGSVYLAASEPATIYEKKE